MNKIPFNKPALSVSQQIAKLWSSQTNCVYNLILILLYLNEQIELPSNWKTDFIGFLKTNSDKCVEFLNFPKGWEKEMFWN